MEIQFVYGSFLIAPILLLLPPATQAAQPAQSAQEPSICADFHAALCGKPDKTKDAKKEDQLLLAMDLGAKQLGAASADAYVREKLKEVSIELPRKLKLPELFQALASAGLEEEGEEKIEITNPPAACQSPTPKALARLTPRMVEMYARGIPEFFALHILNRCPKNKSGSKDCRDLPQIRREGVELFRSEDVKAAKIFVQKHYRAQKDPEALCEEYGTLELYTIGRIVDKARADMLTAREASHYLYTYYYRPETRAQLQGVFADAKQSVDRLLIDLVPDPEKRAAYVEHYKLVDLSWPEMTDLDFESRADGRGQRIRTANLASGGIYDFSEALRDPESEFFGPSDAEYRDPVLQGRFGSAFPNVVLYPQMLKYFETEPDSVAATVAHELGHAIGPLVSEEFGFSLVSEWKDLLACYADREGSIGMREDQRDETIADFVASEYIADKLSELPMDKRLAYLKRATIDMCDAESSARMVMYDDTHPDPYLRINGILGANPRIRQALGCEKPHPAFKTCGLVRTGSADQWNLSALPPR